MKNISKLPENYWDIVGHYLPEYSTRQDIADNDDLAKYIDGEYDYRDEHDLKRIADIANEYKNPQIDYEISNRGLLVEAMEAAIIELKKDIETLEKL